jgi:hypothetical protein
MTWQRYRMCEAFNGNQWWRWAETEDDDDTGAVIENLAENWEGEHHWDWMEVIHQDGSLNLPKSWIWV